MSFTRIVSQDHWDGAGISSEVLQRVKVLLWRDPSTEETLKALSHERKICPLIVLWRQMTESKHSK